MNRLRWPLSLALICLPLVYLALGYRLPWRDSSSIRVAAVPAGDVELAWFNTTTGGATWERFIAGVRRVPQNAPEWSVDESNAFPVNPMAVPEVVILSTKTSAKIRIRWYKISSEQSFPQWVAALAERNPPPLAILGGSSSDRARDYAVALAAQSGWHGAPPLFCVNNATAIDVPAPPGAATATVPLTEIYKGRTFRFCFNNRQMAAAMLDFVWQHPELQPVSLLKNKFSPPAVFSLSWKDDPYSNDMVDQVYDSLKQASRRTLLSPEPQVFRWQVPFSVGGFSTPNPGEGSAADSILKELRERKDQRSLLVIPTVTAPARRVLMRLCEEESSLGKRLVALNGDGMGVNAVLRDGEFNWPLASMPVPLVLFTHNNPAAWDRTLTPPNSTEDVLHNEMIVQRIATAFYDLHLASVPVDSTILSEILQSKASGFFDREGNRLDGTGEFIFLLKPTFETASAAEIEVWTRTADRTWSRVTRRPLPLTGVAP